jgi:hypothetical protein
MNPGTAASTKHVRQPYSAPSHAPVRYDRQRPKGSPSMNAPSARERFSGGNRSPISDWQAGEHVASPMPTPSRAATRPA